MNPLKAVPPEPLTIDDLPDEVSSGSNCEYFFFLENCSFPDSGPHLQLPQTSRSQISLTGLSSMEQQIVSLEKCRGGNTDVAACIRIQLTAGERSTLQTP
uniref:(northern house mosquito) hypothetical protein n=1 Tax=Culex pipiens TaxID=7175 RepID=A0A8D8H4Z2_CULPI